MCPWFESRSGSQIKQGPHRCGPFRFRSENSCEEITVGAGWLTTVVVAVWSWLSVMSCRSIETLFLSGMVVVVPLPMSASNPLVATYAIDAGTTSVSTMPVTCPLTSIIASLPFVWSFTFQSRGSVYSNVQPLAGQVFYCPARWRSKCAVPGCPWGKECDTAYWHSARSVGRMLKIENAEHKVPDIAVP